MNKRCIFKVEIKICYLPYFLSVLLVSLIYVYLPETKKRNRTINPRIYISSINNFNKEQFFKFTNTILPLLLGETFP